MRRDPPRTAAPTTASAVCEPDGVKPPSWKLSSVLSSAGRFGLGDIPSKQLSPIVPAMDASTLLSLASLIASPLLRRSSITRLSQHTAHPKVESAPLSTPATLQRCNKHDGTTLFSFCFGSSTSLGKRAHNGDMRVSLYPCRAGSRALLPVTFCCVQGCTMVIRPLACAASVVLLAAGLRPSSASVFPRFSLGNSHSASRLQEATAWTKETVSASRRRATALRLEQEGQSRLVPERIIRRGPWGLATVRTAMGSKHSRF